MNINSSKDGKILVSGDIVGFQVDAMGFLATPSAFEPIPEKEETVSHLRICSSSNVLESDANRCMFRIDSDIGQKSEILFGSYVKITHIPSEFILVASNVVDTEYVGEGDLKCVYLRNILDNEDELAHKWIISPRYKLREEGDPVRTNDFIVLKNAHFKNLCLTSFPLPAETIRRLSVNGEKVNDFENLAGLDSISGVNEKPGLQIVSLKKHSAMGVQHTQGTDAAAPSEISFVCSSDCIRIFHREYQGHVICRVDDDKEIKSATTPLGSICRKQTMHKDNSHGIYVRPLATQRPKLQHDFASAFSCLGVWQILLTAPSSEYTVHGRVKYGTSIRLRHVLSGQFLSMRPVLPGDSAVLKEHTYLLQPSARAVSKRAARRKKESAAEEEVKSKQDKSTLSEFGSAVLNQVSSTTPPAVLPTSLSGRLSPPVSSHTCYRLSVKSVVAKGLKNIEWISTPSVYLLLSYCSTTGMDKAKQVSIKWNAKTAVTQCKPHHGAAHNDIVQWDYTGGSVSKPSAATASLTAPAPVPANAAAVEGADKMVFLTTKHEMSSHVLKVVAMDKKSLFRDAIIGSGEASILLGHNSVIAGGEGGDVSELVEVHMEILDKNKRPAGTIIVILLKEVATAEESSTAAAAAAVKIEQEQRNLRESGRPQHSGRRSIFSFSAPPMTPLNIPSPFSTKRRMTESTYDNKTAVPVATSTPKYLPPPVSWTVGTSSEPDENTVFTMHSMDGADTAHEQFHYISYNERILLEHVKTGFRMKLCTDGASRTTPITPKHHKVNYSKASPNRLGGELQWWEYSADLPFIPATLKDNVVVDAEVCQLEKVSQLEVQDILYCKRFIPLTRSVTAALQLTPRADQLYLPMFRHFSTALQSLMLWTMNAVPSDAALCDINTSLKGAAGSSGLSLQEIAAQMGADSDEESEEETLGEDSSSKQLRQSAGYSKVLDNDLADGHIQMTRKSSFVGKHSFLVDKHNSSQADSVEVMRRVSAMCPWMGRAPDPSSYDALDALLMTATPLDLFATSTLKNAVDKEMATNENIARRQGILSDTRILDQLLHFLQVFFILQRSISIHDNIRENSHSRPQSSSGLKDSYSAVPLVVRQCCYHIQSTIHAGVYQNDHVALKIIAIQGTFVSMISQKILGWNPPIETILKLVCKDDARDDSAEYVDILANKHIIRRQNGQAHSHHKFHSNQTPSSEQAKADPSEKANGAGASSTPPEGEKVEEDINVETLFMNAITASDIRQIVEQMYDLHLSGDATGALNILQLLTLLCSSGNSKKYFQDLLINAIAKQPSSDGTRAALQSLEESDEEDGGEGWRGSQSDCMLFDTRFFNNQWQVKFKAPFIFPTPEEFSKAEHMKRLKQEALNLKLLFTQYDIELGTDEYLDINECFSLLEDLGLGGPFLYEEIRHLEGSNIFSFLKWWCHRCSIYYPTSSISHCQLSPIQALELMCCPPTPELLLSSNSQEVHDINAIYGQINHVNVINSRIPGFLLSLAPERATAHQSPNKLYSSKSRKLSRTASMNFGRPDSGGFDSVDPYSFSAKKGYKNTVSLRNRWVSMPEALSNDVKENDWFRRSLVLLNEICRGSNIYAQRVANNIMPAECLLEILQNSSVGLIDKHICCDLLCSIYINHDFVFPTSLTPVYNHSIFCGYNENSTRGNVRIGKVFNSLSRVRLTDSEGGVNANGVNSSGGSSGRSLRIQLYEFVTEAITGLQLYSTNKMTMMYINSVLSLLKLLLSKGFFDESEFHFYSSEPARGASLLSRAVAPRFNIHILHSLMLEKLREAVQSYHNSDNLSAEEGKENITESNVSMLTNAASKQAAAAVSHVSEKVSLITKAITGDVSLEPGRKTTRKNLAYIGSVIAQFDALFVETRFTAVMRNVMSVLVTIHDMKQLVRVQAIWNTVCDSSNALALHAQETSSLKGMSSVYVDKAALEKGILATFEEPVSNAAQCEAIFSCTLFHDANLQKKCFNLMNRQLSLTRDAFFVFNNTNCLKSSGKAVSYRMIAVYSDILLKFSAEVLKRPIPTKALLLEKIQYVVDHIKELAVHSQSVYSTATTAGTAHGKKTAFNVVSGGLMRQTVLLIGQHADTGGRIRADRKLHTQYFLSAILPCPAGDDDFHELDLHKLQSSEPAVNELFAHFDDDNQFVADSVANFRKATINCERHMSNLCGVLVDMLVAHAERKVLHYPNIQTVEYVAWESLSEAEMFVYDTVFDLLSAIGSNSAVLCAQWFPKLSPLLMKFTPFCRNSLRLVNTLLALLSPLAPGARQVQFEAKVRTAFDMANAAQSPFGDNEHVEYVVFTRHLLLKLDTFINNKRSSDAVPRKKYPKFVVQSDQLSALLSAAIESEVPDLVEAATNFLFSHAERVLHGFDFRHCHPSTLKRNIALRHDLYFALNPFSLLCRLEVELPDEHVATTKAIFTPDFCSVFLKSEDTPVIIKSRLISIVQRLYSRGEVNIEEGLVPELRRLRMYYSINQQLDSASPLASNGRSSPNNLLQDNHTITPINAVGPPCHHYVLEFLSEAVIPLLLTKITHSDRVTDDSINVYLRKEISGIEVSGLMNNHLHQQNEALNSAFEELRSQFAVSVSTYEEVTAPSHSHSFTSATLSCLMLMLNVLALNRGAMVKELSPDTFRDLTRLCAGTVLFLTTQSFDMSDVYHNGSTSGETSKTRDAMVRRLVEYTQGLVCRRVNTLLDDYTTTYFGSKLIGHTQRCLQAIKVTHTPLKVMENLVTGKSSHNEHSSFLHEMELEAVYPLDFLVGTAVCQFIRRALQSAMRFMDLGGALMISNENNPQVKSRAYASKFDSYSDFDIYMQGGGRYIINLLLYLGQVTVPSQTEFTLIHIFCCLLDNNIDEIRESPLIGLNIKLSLIELETKRLQRIQTALSELGALQFVAKTLGRAYTNHTTSLTWTYAPLAMKLGNEIVSWQNRPLQDHFVNIVEQSIDMSKPPEFNSLLGLQHIIRKCTSEIVKAVSPDEQTRIMKAVIVVFSFVGALCLGDNKRSQKFFTATDTSSKRVVDIIQELSLLTNAMLSRVSFGLTYIQYDQFYEKLAPQVWPSKDTAKRRMLAWHHPNNADMHLTTQYLHTLSVVFENLITMCCINSNVSLLQALSKCPQLLEFLGLMQLNAKARVSTNTKERDVYWDGGNPFKFYRTYVTELHNLGLMDSDPEYSRVKQALSKWSGASEEDESQFDNQNSLAQVYDMLSGGMNNPAVSASSKMMLKASKAHNTLRSNFKSSFGISHALFIRFVRQTEYKCLRLVLSYLEFATNSQSLSLSSLFNDGILIQNMDNIFRRINWSFGELKETYSSTTVAYISLIESIGTHYSATDTLLTAWDGDCRKLGYVPKAIYGSVEIIGADGRLQRLYFPVPAFVKTYWDYPEVQKVKELVVQEVNRNSPEEKIGDFLGQINRLSLVVKRQERLRRWLTPPLHALFGGKTVSYSVYFPKLRVLALSLTLILNMYYCYFTSTSFHPAATTPAYFYTNWAGQEYFIFIVKWVHLSLNGSSALRTILNSSAADNLPELYETDNFGLKVVVNFVRYLLGSLYLLEDCLWSLLLVGMSYGGIAYSMWFYVPCLMDVMFQLKDMFFLYSAIVRNFTRISFTLLLAFLILYFFAILAYLFIGDQYNINGHEACNNNIVACFKMHLDYGLANAPDWNNLGYTAPNLPFSFQYGQLVANILGTLYNLVYVILINLVLQAIISGLIIDTFSTMRAESEAVAQDIADKCFTCSILRDDFEQAGITFSTHIAEEHNMWHYAWFKLYLEMKDPISYSSAENYAILCMQDKQSFLRLMPIKKSFTLEKKVGAVEEEQVEQKLEALRMTLENIQIAHQAVNNTVQKLVAAHNNVEGQLGDFFAMQEEDEDDN